MKTNKQHLSGRLIRACSFLLLMLALVRCSGPEGPMGATGPRGFDGQDGTNGANGANGADGTAFAYSTIYDVDPADWNGNADGYRVTLNVPEITEDIYYEGAVLVYRLIEVDPISFNMLPYTYVDNGFMIYMDFDAYIGSLDLMYKEILDGVNDTFAPEFLMSFKVVIIEGIPLASLKTMVDVRDFVAVSKILGMNNDRVGDFRIY
jgi:hypothetical protein